jgi:hypothetical protein
VPEDFFAHGAGMTEDIKISFMNNVTGYGTIYEYWQGEITLVVELAEFAGVHCPQIITTPVR